MESKQDNGGKKLRMTNGETKLKETRELKQQERGGGDGTAWGKCSNLSGEDFKTSKGKKGGEIADPIADDLGEKLWYRRR